MILSPIHPLHSAQYTVKIQKVTYCSLNATVLLSWKKILYYHSHHPKLEQQQQMSNLKYKTTALVYLANISSLVKCLFVHRFQRLNHTG